MLIVWWVNIVDNKAILLIIGAIEGGWTAERQGNGFRLTILQVPL